MPRRVATVALAGVCPAVHRRHRVVGHRRQPRAIQPAVCLGQRRESTSLGGVRGVARRSDGGRARAPASRAPVAWGRAERMDRPCFRADRIRGSRITRGRRRGHRRATPADLRRCGGRSPDRNPRRCGCDRRSHRRDGFHEMALACGVRRRVGRRGSRMLARCPTPRARDPGVVGAATAHGCARCAAAARVAGRHTRSPRRRRRQTRSRYRRVGDASSDCHADDSRSSVQLRCRRADLGGDAARR